MDKDNAVYIYNGILFSHKKEENVAICNKRMDFKGMMLNQRSQIVHNINYMNVESKKANFIETETRMVVTWRGDWGNVVKEYKCPLMS